MTTIWAISTISAFLGWVVVVVRLNWTLWKGALRRKRGDTPPLSLSRVEMFGVLFPLVSVASYLIFHVIFDSGSGYSIIILMMLIAITRLFREDRILFWGSIAGVVFYPVHILLSLFWGGIV